MSVQFILGRAGSGKTRWCFERILQSIREQPLGPAIYWIVPRQSTFLVQRQLACEGGLGGYFRARVLSFEDLGAEILAECGGTAVPEITDRGRRMILGHLLRQLGDQLQFFKSVAHQPGVAAELDGTFAELQRTGLEASAIQQQLDRSTTHPGLQAKLHDLSLIYERYTKFLGQDRLDPNRRLADALAAIERCRSLRQAEVYFDSFHDFTGSERGVIAAMGKVCRSVCVTLTIDPKSPAIANPDHNLDDMSLFHRTEQAHHRLLFKLKEEGVGVVDSVFLKETRRFKNAPLSSLESAFISSSEPSPKSLEPGSALQLKEAPDRRAEVDALARWIRELTAGSMRYRDIAVLMRSDEEYHAFIEASFREHNIPFFVDRRRSASHHPLLRLIRALLAVATTHWSHEAMMAVLKTGLVGLNDAETDALENYVLLHGIRHSTWISPEPWKGRRPQNEESDALPDAAPEAERIDAIRRGLVGRLGPFVRAVNQSDRLPVKTLASAVFRLLEDFNCRGQIVLWMAKAAELGNLEESGEHERVWEELVKLFDELVDLFGNEQISLKDFSAILDSALEGFDLALTPPTVDQVLVGDVDRTRTPAVKACVVLGLAEGQFPRASREDSVFTDADRRALGKHQIDLDPDTARQLLDENFLGYLAMTRASDFLLLTRADGDDKGRAAGVSPLWQRVVDAFPKLIVEKVPREEDLPPQLIATPRQLVGGLMRWVRSGAGKSAWEAVYQWLATHAACDDAVDVARFRAWKALSYRNDASLDPRLAAAMFASPLKATTAQLETFRMCPYQHFARYGLGLREREEREVSGADLSRIYHQVLEGLVRELINSRQAWPDLDEAQADGRLSQLTARLGGELRDELMLSTARNRYLLAHIEKTLSRVASAQKAAGERGEFRPAFANVRFGDAGAPLPALSIRTPGGNNVLISGKIDRIDLLADGSACVVDYRLVPGRLDASAVFHGLSLQLLSYLLVLEQSGEHLTQGVKLTPAASFCVQLLRQVRNDDPENAPSADDPLFHLLVKPRGIFDLRIANQLDKSLIEGNSKVVQLFIKKDGTLGNPEKSDAAASEDFAALLRHIERRIGELTDEIMTGRIDIRPYRMGKDTPCATCQFRAVCRFEPSPGCYDDLEPMGREKMFERIRGGNS